jgi:hypothetical protein
VEELNCDIYLNWEQPDQELAQTIADMCRGVVLRGASSTLVVETAHARIMIQPGPYFHGSRYLAGKDAFLRYPRRLEIYAHASALRTERVDSIAELLRSFWSRGVPAVAVCDFENELPEGGGIDRLH